MKRSLAAILLAALLALASCGGASPSQSNVSSPASENELSRNTSEQPADESDVSEPSDGEAEALRNEIASLESRLETLQNLLDDATNGREAAEERIKSLQTELDSLNDKLSALQNASAPISRTHVKKGIYLERYSNGLKVVYPGGETVNIPESSWISYLDISPDGNRIVFNNYESDCGSVVRLYDVDAKETETLSITLPEYRAAACMKWLDNRYFLLVSMYYPGTVTRGGDVYAYDTQTGETKPIALNGLYFQTAVISRDNNALVSFTSEQLTGGMFFSEYVYHALPIRDIYDIIASGKTIDLAKVTPILPAHLPESLYYYSLPYESSPFSVGQTTDGTTYLRVDSTNSYYDVTDTGIVPDEESVYTPFGYVTDDTVSAFFCFTANGKLVVRTLTITPKNGNIKTTEYTVDEEIENTDSLYQSSFDAETGEFEIRVKGEKIILVTTDRGISWKVKEIIKNRY